jgi:hypothetical protein
MSSFSLQIFTDNAAFTDQETEELVPAPEIARILRLIADSLTDIPLDADERHLVRDINGNRVGSWSYDV